MQMTAWESLRSFLFTPLDTTPLFLISICKSFSVSLDSRVWVLRSSSTRLDSILRLGTQKILPLLSFQKENLRHLELTLACGRFGFVLRILQRAGFHFVQIRFEQMSSTTTTNESEDGMLSKDQTNSSSFEDGNSRGVGCGTVLKKGPWTSAEDAILIDYVRKHGEGNWNSVQKHSGLSRCGKSCRLRWANHLRPNLKKGAFTTEEEHLIVELHAKLGNKWARMAAYLPGRTDNEIKNYWNTRIKRRQRAGLPLYPPGVCLKTVNEGQHNQNIGEFNTGDTRHNDLLSASSYDIPDVIFDNLRANPGAVSYASHLPNISVSGMLGQGLSSSQSFNFIPPTMHHIKRPRESETLIPGFSGSFINGHTPFGPFQSDSFGKIHRPFGLGLPYDPDPDIKNPAPFAGVMTGSRALSNCNFSTSKSLAGTVKQELPSLQFPETDFGGWDTCPPTTPSLEPADAYAQSPLSPTVQMQSECLSYWDTGLPQAVFHESQTVGRAKSLSAEKSSNSTTVTPTDVMDGSTLNLSEVEWDGYGDPISPLGQSVASVFSACTPPISSSSLEESAPSKALPGLEAKTQQSVEHVSTPEGGDKVTHSEYFRPDALLGGNFFTQSNEYDKALAAFVSEDYSLSDDYKHPTTAGTSVNQEDMELGLYPWCNTSPLHQMSQLPF